MIQVYNVAFEDQVTLNDMVSVLQRHTGKDIQPNYGPERRGDVRHSRADIAKIQKLLGYQPSVLFEEGLQRVYQWYQENQDVLNS